VWESQGRLFLALHHPTTKHYYADGRLIATRHNDELYYVHSDPLGSTTLFTDQGGEAVGVLRYDPMGAVISNTLPARLNRSLVSQLEANSGLQYDGQRYYDPWVGGYIQPDPVGGGPGRGSQLNTPELSNRACCTPYGITTGTGAASISNLVAFALNKSLISTGLEKPLPEGLIKYRLGRQVLPWLRQLPDFSVGISRQFVVEYSTIGTVAGFAVEPQEFERWVLTARRGAFGDRVIQNTSHGFRVIATNYDRTLNLARLVKSVPLEGPLFLLDAGFNAYFQYQVDAGLPESLRIRRAIAGGTGNALISLTVTGIGVTAAVGICAGTAGFGCPVAIGALALTADFTANLAFDLRIKDPLFERIPFLRREHSE